MGTNSIGGWKFIPRAKPHWDLSPFRSQALRFVIPSERTLGLSNLVVDFEDKKAAVPHSSSTFFLLSMLIHQTVGFGGDGPTLPLPLIHAHESLNLGTQTIRLIHTPIPCNTDQSQKWWVYQYRNSSAHEWNTFYAFSEIEFSEADFNVMNVSSFRTQGSW